MLCDLCISYPVETLQRVGMKIRQLETTGCEHAADCDDVAPSGVAPRHEVFRHSIDHAVKGFRPENLSRKGGEGQTTEGTELLETAEDACNRNELVSCLRRDAMDAEVGVVIGSEQLKPGFDWKR